MLRGCEEHSTRNADSENPRDGDEKKRPAETRPRVKKISSQNGDSPENGETDDSGEGCPRDGIYATNREASEDIP